MPFCCYCGAPLLDGARFCHICGKEADLKPHCPHCGSILPEGSRFCSFCGTPLTGQASPVQEAPKMPPTPQPQMYQAAPPVMAAPVAAPVQAPVPAPAPVMQEPLISPTPAPAPVPAAPEAPAPAPAMPMPASTMMPMMAAMGGAQRTIRIPAPEPKVQPARGPVPLPDAPALPDTFVLPVVNPHAFNGSVQRFYGENGSFYSFEGSGMYGFLEPFSMNYAAGQAPLAKHGGKWIYHASQLAQPVEVPALNGAQIITSTNDGMYVYIAPTIYFVSPDGAMRPFTEAAETLTDMLCFEDWLFVTYQGPFEEMASETGGTVCCDRSYVVAYDRYTGDVGTIIERCAGIYYIDKRIIILCDLMDNGEIRRDVYRMPVHGWTEEGFRSLANYVGRIRGSIQFSQMVLNSCNGHGVWKKPSDCSTNLRFCDWQQKMLAFQQEDGVLWRDFHGNIRTSDKLL